MAGGARHGAIVLAGGESSRMGVDKATLDWHGTPLLKHVVAVVSHAVGGGPVVVAARAGQELPGLSAGVDVVRDAAPGRGPLQGVHDGLVAVSRHADAAFVAAVDLPLLKPAFVRAVLRSLGPDDDVAAPFVRGLRQPFAAAYRVRTADAVAALLDDGEHRAGVLLGRCRTRWLTEAELLRDPELAREDPGLESVTNANTPEEWEAALERARGADDGSR
ncbi:MAG TPA: molybdenum cofactor guanylyltransferase [Gaiellaceae bacterium]|nr:molybdenum cofactor guanylyltransferase [Gaiellaceae bacterium]